MVIPAFLSFVFVRGKGAVVRPSLLFTAQLHFSLFGGAFMCLRPIHVMESQLQDNLKNYLVNIGLHLSHPRICCSFSGLIIVRNFLSRNVTVGGAERPEGDCRLLCLVPHSTLVMSLLELYVTHSMSLSSL